VRVYTGCLDGCGVRIAPPETPLSVDDPIAEHPCVGVGSTVELPADVDELLLSQVV